MATSLREQKHLKKIGDLTDEVNQLKETLADRDRLIAVQESAYNRLLSEHETLKRTISDVITGRNLDDGK